MRLFKYKKVVDGYGYFMDMLEKEYIYCSNANEFDDIFDGKMPFGDHGENKEADFCVRKILEEEFSYIDGERHFDEKKWLEEVGETIENTDLSDVTADYEDDYEPSIEELEENKRDEINHCFFTQDEFISFYRKVILKLFELQEKVRICSLCTDNKNPVMWTMYGDHFKGACIEYEIDDSIPKKVIYGNRENMILYFIQCKNTRIRKRFPQRNIRRY